MQVRRKTVWRRCAAPPPRRTTKAMARFGSSLWRPLAAVAAEAVVPLAVEALSRSAGKLKPAYKEEPPAQAGGFLCNPRKVVPPHRIQKKSRSFVGPGIRHRRLSAMA